ncbi:MAG: autotransporter outer membrane beta-barrel domain-containing protein [Pseudomonadales bacterium]|nr:autotransporter outer membrane beta-barrel domain-containing protein [Pseudomonadales bacterium]
MPVNLGAASLSPYFRLNYMEAQVDGYQETGAGEFEFIVDRYEVDSLIAVAGVSATRVVNTRVGAVIPQARIAWAHEHQNDTDTFNYRYAWEAVPSGGSSWVFPIESEEPDRDYFVVGIGVSGVFTGGAQLFADYQTVVGHRRISEHVITGGVRLEF